MAIIVKDTTLSTAEKLAIGNLIGARRDTTPEQTISLANANRLTVRQKEAASIMGYHRITLDRWKNNGQLFPSTAPLVDHVTGLLASETIKEIHSKLETLLLHVAQMETSAKSTPTPQKGKKQGTCRNRRNRKIRRYDHHHRK